MAWTSKSTIMSGQSVAGTEVESNAVTLSPGELAHVQVTADFPVTPTDNLIIRVYTTLDDTSETWDNTSVYSFSLSKAIDPGAVTFIISQVYRFKVVLIRDGSTDTITCSVFYRKDGVSL